MPTAAQLAGSVSVGPDGSPVGSGFALQLYEARLRGISETNAMLEAAGSPLRFPEVTLTTKVAFAASSTEEALAHVNAIIAYGGGGGGGGGFTTAGDGLTSTGTTVNVGAGSGITVNTNDVEVNTAVIATRTFATSEAAGALATALAADVPTTRNMVAGNGLTGGGTLAADRTFNVGQGTGITVSANDVALENMPDATIKGRAVGTGNGAPVNLTREQAAAIVRPYVGADALAIRDGQGFYL